MQNRITVDNLTDRLDADFYKHEFINNELHLIKFGAVQLESLIDNKKSGYGVLPKSSEYIIEDGVKLIRGGDLNGGTISEPKIQVPLNYNVPKGIALKGDVLILIKGACIDGPKGVALISSNNNGYLFNGSCYRLSFKNKRVNSHFFIAYSQSEYFLKQKKRWIANTGISYNDESSIKGYLIPKLTENAQIYIGNKVRQAELLRGWAKENIDSAKQIFELDICWDSKVVEKAKFGRIPVKNLNNRLDHRFNSIEKIKAIDLMKSHNIQFDKLEDVYSISAMIGWKGLTTEFYVDDGPWLLRGVEFSNGVIDFDSLVMVDRIKYLEQPQIHLQQGDIALSKDGTIGKAIVVPKVDNEFAVGSTIARLRKKDVTLDPYYLEFVLNHEFLQVQIESYATGVAQPHITQEWIAQLLIPRIHNESKVAELVEKHHLANNAAKQLTKAAKLLVENLIEGKLSEQDLVAAQFDLDIDDISKDKILMSKLTDEKGRLVFSDINAFYELLEDAALVSEEESDA